MRNIMILLLLMSCKKDLEELPDNPQVADYWFGVPKDVLLTCSELFHDVATCVGSDKELYICVWDTRRNADSTRYNRVACAHLTHNLPERP